MTPRAPARGLVLLEVLLAISIFVIAGLVILSALAEGLEQQRRTRDRQRLADLARSALALIESGALSAESLSGPVRSWPGSLTDGPGAKEQPKGGPQWELRIQTQPWGAAGLTLVTVEASRKEPSSSSSSSSSGAVDAPPSTFVLRQLVRLGGAGPSGRTPGAALRAAAGRGEP